LKRNNGVCVGWHGGWGRVLGGDVGGGIGGSTLVEQQFCSIDVEMSRLLAVISNLFLNKFGSNFRILSDPNWREKSQGISRSRIL